MSIILVSLAGLIYETAGEGGELFYASVSQEWPPTAHVLAAFHVHFHHHVLFFVL
jgi:hypothetical protein